MTFSKKLLKRILYDLIVKNKFKINKNLFQMVFDHLEKESGIDLDYEFTQKKINSSMTSLKHLWKKAARIKKARQNFLTNCDNQHVEFMIKPIPKIISMEIDTIADTIETRLNSMKIMH